jgi:hypothetical protein
MCLVLHMPAVPKRAQQEQIACPSNHLPAASQQLTIVYRVGRADSSRRMTIIASSP